MWTKKWPNISWKSKIKHFFGGGGIMKCSINKATSHPGLEGLFQHVQKEKVAEGSKEKKKKKKGGRHKDVKVLSLVQKN